MTERKKTSTADDWSSVQAYTLAVVCLLVGIAFGWFMRGSQSAASAPVESASTVRAATGAMSAQPTPEQMRDMADKQVEPLLAELKTSPDNPALLARIGNIYYDTQQFPRAVDYYQRALKAAPDDTSVRTDMATAYWYMGDADTAIAEFKKALSYDPHKANTLFNLGIVLWQGKMDVQGALAAWQKLLDTNPNYENKDKLLELMAQARKHSGLKPGTQAKALPE
jgi:cytochrome c-type biogenesis protein CcmH/NrfG